MNLEGALFLSAEFGPGIRQMLESNTSRSSTNRLPLREMESAVGFASATARRSGAPPEAKIVNRFVL
jgi:hypothetical protein